MRGFGFRNGEFGAEHPQNIQYRLSSQAPLSIIDHPTEKRIRLGVTPAFLQLQPPRIKNRNVALGKRFPA